MSGMSSVDLSKALPEALTMPQKSGGIGSQKRYITAVLGHESVNGLGRETLEELRKAAKSGRWDDVIKALSERIGELRDSICGTESLKVGDSASFNGGTINSSLQNGNGSKSRLAFQINTDGKSYHIECPFFGAFNGKPEVGSIVISSEAGVAVYMLAGRGNRTGQTTACMIDKDGNVSRLCYKPALLRGKESPDPITEVFLAKDSKGKIVPYGIVAGFAVQLTEAA